MNNNNKKQRKKSSSDHRSKIFIFKTITASSPYIQIDCRLTPDQIALFIKGLKYILPCQSRLCARRSIDSIIHEQYETIASTVKSCLQDNGILSGDPRGKQAFSILERTIHEFYSRLPPKPLMKC